MRPIARLLTLTLSLVLLSTATVLAATPSIVIDGSTLPADVPALVSGSHILVPLRGVFERFGARVWFDAASSTASASLSGSLVQVTVGSKTAWVNGKSRQLDVAPTELAGRVMIPLRFVAEALGVARETVSGSEPLPATQALVDTLVDLTKYQPLVAGPAARNVYESQIPAVAAPYDRCHPALLSERSRPPSPTALPASGRSGRRISYSCDTRVAHAG